MAIVTVNDSTLTDIADSIRAKLGVQTTYKPSEMPDAIDSISGGDTPTGTKTITANGTGIDVASYAYADVAVPNSYSSGDEGKVVSNGALVSQTSDTVTQNGTVDTTLINSLAVNVSGGGNFASGSFTPSSNSKTHAFSISFQPTGMLCYALKDGYPSDNVWKMYSFAYTGASDGGFRLIRYAANAPAGGLLPTSAFAYSNGTFTVTSDYNFIAGITYYWYAW